MSSADLRPLLRAVKSLSYALPLDGADARYVPRPDGLVAKVVHRVLAPTAPMLLVAGPAGCGKSTELLRVAEWLRDEEEYFTVHLALDRVVDLHRLSYGGLLVSIVAGIARKLAEDLGFWQAIPKHLGELLIGNAREITGRSPAAFVVNPVEPLVELANHWTNAPTVDSAEVTRFLTTMLQVVTSMKRGGQAALVIDGLEKLRPDLVDSVLGPLVQSKILAAVTSVVVVPHWKMFGWNSYRMGDGIDVLQVPPVADGNFVVAVLSRRAGVVAEEGAWSLVAELSGYVLRDALQLASAACREAMDAGTARVTRDHVYAAAQRTLFDAYVSAFSDDAAEAWRFLAAVRTSGALSGSPLLRDRMLASGAVLPTGDGRFRIHPVLDRFGAAAMAS